MTLAEFLLARIAEDEAEARRELEDGYGDLYRNESGWSSGRVLAECEAKRRIVERHGAYYGSASMHQDDGVPCCRICSEGDIDGELYGPWPCETLKDLALPHADHPDYREEWRP